MIVRFEFNKRFCFFSIFISGLMAYSEIVHLVMDRDWFFVVLRLYTIQSVLFIFSAIQLENKSQTNFENIIAKPSASVNPTKVGPLNISHLIFQRNNLHITRPIMPQDKINVSNNTSNVKVFSSQFNVIGVECFS